MELTKEDLARMAQAYKKDTAQQIAEQAVKNNGIHASSERENVVVTKNNFVFSVDVDDEAVANQRQSGRCWMYSALNFLRFHMEKKLKLPKGSFELSQAYNFFYDKLEKSNFFMENIIKYAGSDLNDRRIDFLLATPQQDGGDFDPIVALVEKYGVVPEEAMPETAVTKDSSELDALLNRMLREDAYALRKLVAEGKSDADIEEARKDMLSDIYRVLCVSFGNPPEKIDFVYRDTDKKYHADRGLTPLEFYKKYLGDVKLEDCIGVINLPVEGMDYNKSYEIDMTGEVLPLRQRADRRDEAGHDQAAQGRRAGVVRLRRAAGFRFPEGHHGPQPVRRAEDDGPRVHDGQGRALPIQPEHAHPRDDDRGCRPRRGRQPDPLEGRELVGHHRPWQAGRSPGLLHHGRLVVHRIQLRSRRAQGVPA